MMCHNGMCGGAIETIICCFECPGYADCPDSMKCDDKEGFEAKTCGGME